MAAWSFGLAKSRPQGCEEGFLAEGLAEKRNGSTSQRLPIWADAQSLLEGATRARVPFQPTFPGEPPSGGRAEVNWAVDLERIRPVEPTNPGSGTESTASRYRCRNLTHPTKLIILKRLLDFGVSVHHKRSATDNRLGDGFSVH